MKLMLPCPCREDEKWFFNLPPKDPRLDDAAALANRSRLYGLECNVAKNVDPVKRDRVQHILRAHRLLVQAIRREVRGKTRPQELPVAHKLLVSCAVHGPSCAAESYI